MREIRHPIVRCFDIILAGRPSTRPCVPNLYAPRLKARSGASTTFRSLPPSPITDTTVQQDLVDIKVNFIPLRALESFLSLPKCYQINRLGNTCRKFVHSCTIFPTSPTAAHVDGAAVLLLAHHGGSEATVGVG
jgi:hypothetical protein